MFPTINNKIKKLNLPVTYHNVTDLTTLKNNNFVVSYNSVGSIHLLFFTKYKRKNACFLIDCSKLPFSYSLIDNNILSNTEYYNNTLFIGKYITHKNIFIIDDIYLHQSSNTTNINFNDRQQLILTFCNSNTNNTHNIINIINKQYFEFKFINDLYTRLIPSLEFECNGLLFKDTTNYANNKVVIIKNTTENIDNNVENINCVENTTENINCVDNNVENINCVDNNVENINCVENTTENINCVDNNVENINCVDNNVENINCVDNNVENINCVENTTENINCVDNNVENINCVDNNVENINCVENTTENINCVDNNVENINCVDNNVENINCVDNNVENINCVDNNVENTNISVVNYDGQLETFMVKRTDMPDIYKLYYMDGNRYVYKNIALVLTLKCSIYMREVFKRRKMTEYLSVKCKYNSKFSKWMPCERKSNNQKSRNKK
jgi:hypothetical protein